MKAKDRVLKAHVAIMQHKVWCAVSGVLACGKTEVNTTTPTACTNGWDVTYGEKFIDSLNDAELRFLVLHETTHKAYRHMSVWKTMATKDLKGANIAMDHFVNLTLEETDKGEGFIKMPKCGIQPEKRFHGMSVGQIYEVLQGEAPPPQGQPQDGDGGMDQHDHSGSPGEEAEAAQATEIERAIRQGEIVRRKRAGLGSGDQAGVFGELLTPKVDWREVLREFVQSTCQGNDESTWRKPNRRYLADDVYMPSAVSERVEELVVGFDTSGSCFGGAEMTRFVSEIAAIVERVRPAKCHIVYWDTKVTAHQTFEDGQFAVAAVKPKGGGGTDGAVLFDYLRDKRINPAAIVQFSDGEVGSFGKSDWPTLWALTSSNLRSPYGTTVHI